jgi:hypothetical protein
MAVMQKNGADVRVAHTREKVDSVIKEIEQTTTKQNSRQTKNPHP